MHTKKSRFESILSREKRKFYRLRAFLESMTFKKKNF